MARWPSGDQSRHLSPGLAGFSADQAGFFLPLPSWAPSHWLSLTTETDNPLRPRTSARFGFNLGDSICTNSFMEERKVGKPIRTHWNCMVEHPHPNFR